MLTLFVDLMPTVTYHGTDCDFVLFRVSVLSHIFPNMD